MVALTLDEVPSTVSQTVVQFVTKAFATWLVVLCLLPNTAPFAAVGPDAFWPSFNSGSHAEAARHVASNVGNDDNDAIALERTSFRNELRTSARIIVAHALPGGMASHDLSVVAYGAATSLTSRADLVVLRV